MGCYDEIRVICPKCKEDLYFQSKGGECLLSTYTLENCPDDVMSNANRHSPYQCGCGYRYEIDIINRKLVRV